MTGAVFMPLVPGSVFAASKKSGRRVILVELAGANDGLNTLIPFTDHRYSELRPKIGLGADKITRLTSEFAINSALDTVMPAWEKSELAFIHGLGYPSPSHSHFKSMAIWETGSDGNRQRRDGWITHDIEHAYAARSVDAHGISLGGGMGVFSGAGGSWLSMQSIDQYLGRQVKDPGVTASNNAALATVLEQTAVLSSSLQRISKKLSGARHRSRIRGEGLSQQMNHVVNLINAGIDVPVIKVTLGGFDTHENQQYRHTNLMVQLGRALAGLRKELIKSDEWQNTTVVTYSEFGRRAHENLSGGTDHGTAAAHFVMGGALAGGLYGDAPDLGDLVDGDLKFTMDYRALYNELLGSALGLSDNRFASFEDARLRRLLG